MSLRSLLSSFLETRKKAVLSFLETIILLFVSVSVIVFNELKAVLRDQFLESSYLFSAFFLLSNLFLLFWFWKQLPNLFSFEFEISSFLLFGNKKESSSFFLETTIILFFVSVSVIVFNELKAVLRDQFIESSYIFPAFFLVVKLVFIVFVLKTITKTCFEFEIFSFLLSAFKNKSLPIFGNK